jgi:DNA helicase-2/ATP-dependent DNA helicase PcrA
MGSYEEALSRLNQAQKKAVETIDGPVLVIAGPGTGKTQLLTTRVAHILANTDTLPQNVLCLTFTDSAAQTMRERLAGLIGQGAYDVAISTYHAFGSDIIRNYPDFFADQPDLLPADDLTTDRILREIISGLPYNNPLKYSDAYLYDLKTLISEAKRALLSPNSLQGIANENLKFIKTNSPKIKKALSGMKRLDARSIPLFRELAKSGNEEPFYKSLRDALDEAGDKNTKPLTAWKNAWLEKDENGEFVVAGARANQKILAAADVYEQYLMELKARGLFDYDDMILRAVEALQNNTDLRYTLQEKYQYLLLDEFQDTNGAQLRLVELLTDNPVFEGRPNVLAVGDDDQAIYAFQGADYSHMVKFRQMYRDVEVINLTQNYRSHPRILELAGSVAAQIEERLDADKKLAAAAKITNAVVERREAKSDAGQFAWAAKRIKKLIEQGIAPSEIAVLAPGHKHLEPLVPFLQQQDIPLRYEKRENVLDDPAINQLLDMSRLVLALEKGDHQTASHLWPRILSFDFWRLPTETIWRLSWHAADEKKDWTNELLDQPSLQPIALFFIRLSQLSGGETLETMTDYLIGSQQLNDFKSPFYDFYFKDQQDGLFWSLLTNLIVLRTRLRAYRKDGDEHLSLADFVEFAQAHRAAELKIVNTSPYASAADAVQVMTVYKAKGMEFKAVFLLALNDETWGSKSRLQTSRISLPPNLQHIRYAGATEDERLRLLFVALTRAKSQIYLISYSQNYAGRNMTPLKYLLDYDKILPAEEQTPEPTTELQAFWQTKHLASLSQDNTKALLKERLKNFRLSPTHVCTFLDLEYAGPETFFRRIVLRFPEAPKPQVHYGNAMHETLEWLHRETKRTGTVPSTHSAHKAFEGKLQAKRLNSQHHGQFLERGNNALSVYLEQRRMVITPHDISEYNFRNEGVLLGHAHLTGKIDKLIIDKTAREITIVDYKTGPSHKRWTKTTALYKYKIQLYLYKTLLEKSHTFAGYKVTGAYLDFVEPDETGNLNQLHLTFDDAEHKRINQLAEVIWQRIIELDLPNAEPYTANIRGIEDFEHDLIS